MAVQRNERVALIINKLIILPAPWRKFLVKVNLAAVNSSVDMKDPAVMESIMNLVICVIPKS